MYGYAPERKRGRFSQDTASMVPPQFLDRLTSKEVREGDKVQFTIRVAGNPPPEVTWYREGSQIVSSPDFEIQQQGDVHALYIPEVFYEDSGKFTVKAESRAGQTSCTAELIVEAPAQEPETAPVFEVTLTNQPLQPGQTAYFECRVSANPPPEILWTRKGHPLVDKARYKSTYDQFSGVTTLTILNLCIEDEGEYTCTAINNQGETSTSGTLLGSDRYADWLKQQKGDTKHAMVSELDNKFAAPKPTPGAFYRPMSERALDDALEQQVPAQPVVPDQGFKVSSFEKRLEQEIEYREGRVHPKHHHADAQEAFDDSVPTGVAAQPQFEQKLKNFQLMEGSDAAFICKVNGNPRPHIQWFHNGRLIRPTKRYEMKLTRDGYVSLRIRVAFPEDQGHYTCCATNIVGRDMCSAELYIDGIGIVDETSYVSEESLRRMTRSHGSRSGSQEPGGVSEKHYRPVFRKVPADQEVPEGKVCRFDSVVSGRPMPEFFWFRDDVQVHDDANHKIVVNEDGIHSLIIHATQNWDAGLYTCIARNRGGEARFQVRLNVTARQATQAPRFMERMLNTTVTEGSPVHLHAEATGHPTPMMSWQKDGRHIDQDPHYEIQSEAGRSEMRIQQVDVKDSAWFQCTAVNVGGTATNRSRLIVQPRPRSKEPDRKLFIPKKKKVPTATLR